VHERQQAARWRDAGAMEEESVPRVGCIYLSGHSPSLTSKKIRRYLDIVSVVDFSPFATLRHIRSGVWEEHGLELVTEIGRRITAVTLARCRLLGNIYEQYERRD